MSSGNAGEVASNIASYLASRNLPPAQQWMQSFMRSIRLNTPIASLQKTALYRMLASDLTSAVEAQSMFLLPSDISNASTKERSVRGPVTVQILDIEDIGRSRWSQVEAIETHERGETTKGREVIRLEPDENSTGPTAHNSKFPGVHKVLLQDAAGTMAYGIELTTVNGLTLHTPIGTKLALKDLLVARGVALLEPKNVEVLGGRVETWDNKWREERKRVLKAKAGMRDGS